MSTVPTPTSTTTATTSSGSSSAGKVRAHYSTNQSLRSGFSIILILILLLNIPGFAANGGDVSYYFSFERFMNMLSDVPQIDFSKITSSMNPIDTDWGVFNFFRDFLNSLYNVMSGIAFIALGIAQLVVFFVYFIPFIFGV